MERWDRNDRLEKSINAQSKVFTCDPFGKWEADGDKPTEILATDEIDVKCEVKGTGNQNSSNGIVLLHNNYSMSQRSNKWYCG